MECQVGTWCVMCHPRATVIRAVLVLLACLAAGAAIGWWWPL